MPTTARKAVHPRVGGEQSTSAAFGIIPCGSSPRGRGTERCGTPRQSRHRFIPAWAGNRHGAGLLPRPFSGSSPRGRGTERCGTPRQSRHRFIPAWAGNSRAPASRLFPAPVHPRVGGEQPGNAKWTRHPPGSSPRGRGTDFNGADHQAPLRFIPAWAGNSPPRIATTACGSVHPRVGGEQTRPVFSSVSPSGSSPRGRGTVFPKPAFSRRRRFIPAWAGNRLAPLVRIT